MYYLYHISYIYTKVFGPPKAGPNGILAALFDVLATSSASSVEFRGTILVVPLEFINTPLALPLEFLNPASATTFKFLT